MPPISGANLRSLLILGFLAILPACSRTEAPNAPPAASAVTPQVAEDLAQHAAGMLARGGVPLDRVAGQTVGEVAQNAAREPGRFGAQQEIDEGGFSWSFSIMWFDADNRTQENYVHGATARARIEARARGSVTTARHHASVGIARELDIGGLLPDSVMVVLNGAAHDTASCDFESGDGLRARRYDLLGAGAFEAVRTMKDPAVNPYPLSGVLTWNVVADALERDEQGERTAHYQARVVVTFNGTRHPIIEVEKKWRYSLDLDTGAITVVPS
jgi:hypothetical protein